MQEDFKDRLKKAIDVRGLKQIELSEKANISRSTISQYMSGYTKPKSKKLYLIAQALDVNEAWLMGYDVPMERNIQKETKSNYSPNELTKKDEKSIQKDLKQIMDDFKSGQDGPAFYNGVELGDEELELIEQAMELALRSAKLKNKAKYTPKKYKKEE